jgi:hypothetical protein
MTPPNAAGIELCYDTIGSPDDVISGQALPRLAVDARPQLEFGGAATWTDDHHDRLLSWRSCVLPAHAGSASERL